jgi:hypothetical protein
MRRLILVASGIAIVGVALYRQRSIDRGERELAIGKHIAERGDGRQPSSAPSS